MTPSAESCRDGAKLARKNADHLLDAARSLAAGGLYGPATSLLVLGLEEACKGWGLSMRAAGLGIDLRPILRDHNSRQLLAALLPFLDSKGAELAEDVIANLVAREDELASADGPTIIAALKDELASAIGKVRGWAIGDVVTEAKNARLVDEWFLDHADDIKQAGFYVDYADHTWIAPSDVQKKEYDDTLGHVTKAISAIDQASGYLSSLRQPAIDLMKEAIKIDRGANRRGSQP